MSTATATDDGLDGVKIDTSLLVENRWPIHLLLHVPRICSVHEIAINLDRYGFDLLLIFSLIVCFQKTWYELKSHFLTSVIWDLCDQWGRWLWGYWSTNSFLSTLTHTLLTSRYFQSPCSVQQHYSSCKDTCCKRVLKLSDTSYEVFL